MKIKRILKGLFIAFVCAFLLFIAARIFLLGDNDTLSELYPTDSAISAYNAGENFIYHEPFESIADDGYYSSNGFIYCESTGEVQITGRYNDSLYTYMDAPEDTEFTWKLVDKANELEWEGEVVAGDEKYIYNYRRIIFSDVEICETSELYLFLCWGEEYPLEETKGLLIHHPGQVLEDYKLSKEEIAALTK